MTTHSGGAVAREVPEEAERTLLGQGLEALAARVFAARGVDDVSQLETGLEDMHPPDLLRDAGVLADTVARAIGDGRTVSVVGDGDADGITATAILVETLRDLGGAARHHIPPRAALVHGITPEIVRQEADAGARVILTVDNGVDAFAAAEEANRLGVELCVTDHHLPRERLPDARCLVNPNRADCRFPSKALSGAGVALYAAAMIRRKVAGERAFPAGQLDLAAIGTIGDWCRFDRNNRILVAQGIRRISHDDARPGIRALLRQAKRPPATMTTLHVTRHIVPALNSAGRLGRCDEALGCLLARSDEEARDRAGILAETNRERQAMQARVLDGIRDSDGIGTSVVTLFKPGWQPGIAGIVASRMSERRRVPVFALCRGGPGQVRGSGRGPAGINLHWLVTEVDRRVPGLLSHWGGHPHAVGVALAEERVGEFASAADSVAGPLVPKGGVVPEIPTDGDPSPQELTVAAARQISCPAWGNGFERPRFLGEFEKVDEHAQDNRRRMTVRLGAREFKAVTYSEDAFGGSFRALYRIVPDGPRRDSPLLVLERQL